MSDINQLEKVFNDIRNHLMQNPIRTEFITTLPGIFGRDRDENFISKWLAFLLDPTINGFGCAPLNALLGLVDEDYSVEEPIEVVTEKRLGSRRIDLFIATSEYFIGIENKLWAGEQQDQTKDYAESITKEATEQRKKAVCILLKPEGNPITSDERFKIVTYSSLCEAFKQIPHDLRRDGRKSQFFFEFILYMEEILMSKPTSFPEMHQSARLYIEYIKDIDMAKSEYTNHTKELAEWIRAKMLELSAGKFKFYNNPSTFWQILEHDDWRKLSFHFELTGPSPVLMAKEINLVAHIEGSRDNRMKFLGKYGPICFGETIKIDFDNIEAAEKSLNHIIERLSSPEFQKWAQRANELCELETDSRDDSL